MLGSLVMRVKMIDHTGHIIRALAIVSLAIFRALLACYCKRTREEPFIVLFIRRDLVASNVIQTIDKTSRLDKELHLTRLGILSGV